MYLVQSSLVNELVEKLISCFGLDLNRRNNERFFGVGVDEDNKSG